VVLDSAEEASVRWHALSRRSRDEAVTDEVYALTEERLASHQV
jgi:hypothetical protein